MSFFQRTPTLCKDRTLILLNVRYDNTLNNYIYKEKALKEC